MKHATGSALQAKARAQYPGLSIHFARESAGRFGKMAERLIIIIIIIIKYLYSANILKVQKRFTEVTLKILKTLFSRPQTLSSDNIADIVGTVVGAFGNLPSNPSNESGKHVEVRKQLSFGRMGHAYSR